MLVVLDLPQLDESLLSEISGLLGQRGYRTVEQLSSAEPLRIVAAPPDVSMDDLFPAGHSPRHTVEVSRSVFSDGGTTVVLRGNFDELPAGHGGSGGPTCRSSSYPATIVQCVKELKVP